MRPLHGVRNGSRLRRSPPRGPRRARRREHRQAPDNQEGLEATAAITTLLNQANAAVTRLHGRMHNKYASDPDKIHAWKQASRVESVPAPPEPDPEPPTP